MKTVNVDQGMKTMNRAMPPRGPFIDKPFCKTICQRTSDNSRIEEKRNQRERKEEKRRDDERA